MIAQNEKTVADKVLEQFEMTIDLIATKFINGKSNRVESQQELDGIERICKDVVNVLHPINAKKAEYVYELFVKASELLKTKAEK